MNFFGNKKKKRKQKTQQSTNNNNNKNSSTRDDGNNNNGGNKHKKNRLFVHSLSIMHTQHPSSQQLPPSYDISDNDDENENENDNNQNKNKNKNKNKNNSHPEEDAPQEEQQPWMIKSFSIKYHTYIDNICLLLSKQSKNTVNTERFHKLVRWLDFNDSFFAFLKQAWMDENFWPFLSTLESAEMIKQNPTKIIIRLSNQVNGTITVTRNAKVVNRRHHTHSKSKSSSSSQAMAYGMNNNNSDNTDAGAGALELENVIKHKRYFPSQVSFGKLILTGSNPQRDIDWNGLISYLKQDECCICLEALTVNVYRINCGHHFHDHCIKQHLKYAKANQSAVCPLCRHPISSATQMKEPELMNYGSVNEVMNLVVNKEKTLRPSKYNKQQISTTTTSSQQQPQQNY